MCMLIYHPENAEPFYCEEFHDFHRKNRQGFGIIWRAPSGAVRWRKGLMNLDQTWGLYRKLLGNGCKEMVLHWRLATAGPVNYENCHPVEVTPEVLLMHNGVLQHRHTATQSDTLCFVEDVIRPTVSKNAAYIHLDKFQKDVDKAIGWGNKLILWRTTDRKPVIIGEERGLWYQGRWYSNTYAWSAPADARPRR